MAARGHEAGLIAAVAIGIAEIFDGHARHQKVFEHAVFDHVHALRRSAFVVEVIGASEFHACHFVNGWIVHHAKEFRQDSLANFLGESLAFFFVTLSVPFQSVAEDFVKEDGSGTAAQQGRTVVRLSHGSFAESIDIRRHFVDFGREFGFWRQALGIRSLKGFDAEKLHAVLGARLRLHHQARGGSGRNERGAFIRHHTRIGIRNLENHRSEINLGISAEGRRQALDFGFPRRVVERRGGGFNDMSFRFFLGEIGRFVLFLGADSGVGANVHESGNSALVFAIGELPQYARNSVLIIAEREAPGSDAARTALAVGVVEFRGAYTHGDVGKTALCRGVAEQAAEGSCENDEILIVDRVTQVVGGLLGFAEFGDGARKLGLHSLQDGIVGGHRRGNFRYAG